MYQSALNFDPYRRPTRPTQLVIDPLLRFDAVPIGMLDFNHFGHGMRPHTDLIVGIPPSQHQLQRRRFGSRAVPVPGGGPPARA